MILEGDKLDDFKSKLLKEVTDQADAFLEKCRQSSNLKTESEIQSQLQAEILLELRKQNQLAETEKEAKEAIQKEQLLTQQDRFLMAANEIYTKTPEYEEPDTFITTKQDKLIKAFYNE
jgi:hypothetical protein